jgi:glyoxylase-like metal-dependent hydrolase (beta-lactamase superfamily II)
MDDFVADTIPIDVNFLGRPRGIAACLLRSPSALAVVDPGPESTLPALRAGLAAQGVSVGDLDAILLTHIHFDHAGATGTLVRENPRLAVYVHEKGAPHMADPAKLLSSAARLYGDAMHKLYGEFIPVPRENLRVLKGGEKVSIGSRDLNVLYTPGHASHHVSYMDSARGIAFVGDTAGIRIAGQPFVMPVTPPPDIDLETWHVSVALIRSVQPAMLFVTHFGFAPDPLNHLREHMTRLEWWAELVRESLQNSGEDPARSAEFVARASEDMRGHLPEAEVSSYANTGGLALSWLGLARYWRKRQPQ